MSIHITAEIDSVFKQYTSEQIDSDIRGTPILRSDTAYPCSIVDFAAGWQAALRAQPEAAAQPAQPVAQWPNEPRRPEDWMHPMEERAYQCKCAECGCIYVGEKRSGQCRKCAGATPQPAPEAALPAGFVAVPMEPTEEMWTAGRDPVMFRDMKFQVPTSMEAPAWRINPASGQVEKDQSKGTTAVHVYRAMLAARPPLPTAIQGSARGGPQPVGDVVVSWDAKGRIVAVTRQDDEGRILSVIAELDKPPIGGVREDSNG